MVAVDNSKPMIDTFSKRLEEIHHQDQIDLQCNDIRQIHIEHASVVAMNFTLQFIAKGHRDTLVAGIYNGLTPRGVFLFSEKIDHNCPIVAGLQQDMYYNFKKENGYSDLEISQKREALDSVLVPEALEDHLERLKWAGFRTVDVWLKWYNFAALIALK
jgi:tRNA (cmo5U34)-methyltransferase